MSATNLSNTNYTSTIEAYDKEIKQLKKRIKLLEGMKKFLQGNQDDSIKWTSLGIAKKSAKE